LTRRHVGHLAARLDELPLHEVGDARTGRIKHSAQTLLKATLTGLAAGCKGLAELEQLLADLATGARRALRLRGRVPDTTMRDFLVRLDPGDLRRLLHVVVRRAHRRKQLVHDLPVRAVSFDGKATATWLFDPPDAATKYGQRQDSVSVVRTVTSCLVSTPARPCLDAFPIPPETNEMGVFPAAFQAVLDAYGDDFFDVAMYDSGATSLANATLVRERGKHYVLSLTDNQPTLLAEAQRLLGGLHDGTAEATSTDLDGSDIVTRTLWTTSKMAGWLDWEHLRTVVRIRSVRVDRWTGQTRSVEDRYYLASLEHTALAGDQWLTLLRRRWAVENECHNLWDSVFREDERPWIRAPKGMVVVMVLRRLVSNLIALYRCVTTRAEHKRAKPWTMLLREIWTALLQATEEAMACLRRRNSVTG
jgi:hypothetical protein